MKFKEKKSIYSNFLIINIIFSILISIRYFLLFPEFPSGWVSWTFIFSSVFSQMALLGFIISLLGAAFIFTPKKIFYALTSLLASVALLVLLIDTFVFAQYRFHINSVVLKLALSGDVVDFSAMTWAMCITVFALLCFAFLYTISNIDVA